MRTVDMAGLLTGTNQPIRIIAEIGGNFTDFEYAKKLIDLACECGADAVKLQTYRAETISSRNAMYNMPNTGVANQFDLFKKYEIDFELHKEIWDYCKEKQVPVFSTPSHISDVELLERLDCQVYKIGSDDAYNIPFLKEVASIGKPIILATGMCTLSEVEESVSAILGVGNSDLILLHCVTNYPADPADTNLRCIQTMQSRFGLPVGFSDHTKGTMCCLAAASIGAHVLEKHFTYDKNAQGPDHMLSADPEELRAIVEGVKLIEQALGDGVKKPALGESQTRHNNRKGIVATKDIPTGTTITKEMIAIKRPGHGIMPKWFDHITGRVATKDILAENPVYWDSL